MGSYTNHSPLTLPVLDLAKARDFYLAALEPLAYCAISEVRHRSSAGQFPDSEVVGLGPQGTNRIDLFLSKSTSSGAVRAEPAHVVFPASSRVDVREVYAAALNAGGAPLSRPADDPVDTGTFAAVVIDPDGNSLEVAFSDPNPGDRRASQSPVRPRSIQRWRDTVAGSSASVVSQGSAVQMPTANVTIRTAPATSKAMSQSGRDDGKSASIHKSNAAGNYSNAVVGTAIGAAAGAALAYTMLRSRNDSVDRDQTFASRMDARQRRLKDEAWAHQRQWEQDMKAVPRRSSREQRDSGYYSERSHRQYDPSPPRDQRRNITYSTQEAMPSRGRSSEYKMVEYRPAKEVSPGSHRDPPRRRSSVREGSERTVRPVRRSASTAGARGYELVQYESTAPSMPPLPATRSRRGSRTSDEYHGRRRSEVPQIEGPPSSYSERRRTEIYRSESTSRDAPQSRRSSTQTARRVALPASVAPSVAVKASLPPSAPPSAASAALTAKALAEKDRSEGPGAGSKAGKLDDLGTIVPDDSISCAPTNNYEYYERKERGSRTSKARSRTSRHDDRPRSGIVAG